jgi:hypothetical protein
VRPANAPKPGLVRVDDASTMVSGKAPVGATELAVVRDSLLNVGNGRMEGIPPVEPTNSLSVPVDDSIEAVEEAVGETSSVSGKWPVEATLFELGDGELAREDAVGEGSFKGMLPPVEAANLFVELEMSLGESIGELTSLFELLNTTLEDAVGEGSSVGMRPPVEATNALNGAVVSLSELALEDKVGFGSSIGMRPPVEATNELSELEVTSLLELLVTMESVLEDTVGWGSLEGIPPPVEATKLFEELVLTGAAESTEGLDSLVDSVELETPVPLLNVKFEGRPEKRSPEVVLEVGCGSLLGTPADDGPCPKFSLRSEVAVVETDDVGCTISSLLGIPTEGCCEELEEDVGCTISSLLGMPTEGCCEELEANVGCTISSLLGIPTEGCCEENTLVLDSTSEEDVVVLSLEKVGCGSLLGTGPTEGCCANLSAERVLRLEVDSTLEDEVNVELGAVGCTGFSGIPLEGALKKLICSVVGSYSSLVAVEVVSEEELGELGCTMSSLFGSPADGCVLDGGVVDCTVLSVVGTKVSSSSVELDELVVATCELEVVEGGGDDVSVFVMVIVVVPVSPSRVGSITVVYSVCPGVDQGLSSLKLERKGAQSK